MATTQTTTRNVTNEATGAQVAIPVGQFTATTPQFDRTHLMHVNSDYQTERHRISGRYNYTRNPFVTAGPLPVPQFNSNSSFNTHRIVFSDVWTVSPRVVNEFRAGYNRSKSNSPVDLPAAPGTTDIFGNYTVTELSLGIGPQSNLPQSSVNNIYQFLNNTSIIVGAHTFKFGPEIRNIISKSDFLPRARGDYVWTTLDQFVRDRFPTSTGIRGVGLGAFSQNRTAYYAFFQDNWKVHPRVTMEYGIRYEFTTIARDQRLQDLNGIANIVSVRDETFGDVGLTPPSGATASTKIFDTLPAHHQQAILFHVGDQLIFRQPNPDNNNFAPRVGIAWDLNGDGRTSLRAGAAIAHDVIFGNLPLLQLPPQAQAENRESNACLLLPSPRWCGALPSLTANPQQSDAVRHSTIGFLAGGGLLPALPPATRVNRLTARRATGNFVVPEEVVPETYTWSLSLQREQFQDWLFEARYVGTRGVHLPIQMWRNPGVPNPVQLPLFLDRSQALTTNFAGRPSLAEYNAGVGLLLAPYGFNGVLTTFAPDGQSWYHGGSISVEKRMSRGLQFNSSYTWSKTIDLIENELFTSFLNPRRPKSHYDIFAGKGLSGLHREHKFVVSWLYDIPGREGSGALAKLTNGWQFNGMYIGESGQPITIISNTDVNGDVDGAGETAFFNVNGQANTGSGVDFICRNALGIASIVTSAAACTGGSANVVGYVAQNPNAQFIRGAGGLGDLNLGRNTHIMPGINTWNLALFKRTPFWGEDREIEFRIEMWNAFNHPNFALGSGNVTGRTGPSTTLTGYAIPGGSQFLDKTIISGGGGNAPFQRIIQWGAKIHF
ncbi:MAG: hypothetical protein HY646_08835 [Acidobacteria bacterium]|nr:hypothetical protein [Acidobacteriota bacterium]